MNYLKYFIEIRHDLSRIYAAVIRGMLLESVQIDDCLKPSQ